jgi:hypothetical protein
VAQGGNTGRLIRTCDLYIDEVGQTTAAATGTTATAHVADRFETGTVNEPHHHFANAGLNL